MARFKKFRRYASRARGMFRRGKSRRGFGGNRSPLQIDAMAYGAVRTPIANFIVSKTGQFAGNYTDEILMGTLDWFLAKSGPGMIRSAASKGLTIENYRVGELVASGLNLGGGVGGSMSGGI